MTENHIAVCDGDQAYVQAFASYLMEHVENATISSFTSQEAFLASDQKYKVGIMSRDFLGVQEFSGDRTQVEEKFYLCDENIAPEYEHLPMVYKYQSMEIVEDMIRRVLSSQTPAKRRFRRDDRTKFIGIYSPISHELSMPFALSLCQVLRESGSVLFLDLEELSILNRMIGRNTDRCLMDLLYMIMQDGQLNIRDYTCSFMGIDLISPFSSPEEIGEIAADVWLQLFEALMGSGYDSVVVLFGRLPQGFKQLVELCSELLVLGKPGDYYGKSQERFLGYLEDNHFEVPTKSVMLPMSAGNLVDGTYAMEELIQGNLGMFVRKMLRDGSLAGEISYERAG